MASVTFGGMCVTGTIAFTATNVRPGAHGPVAGMMHALDILLFMLVASPLASYIPLAALGAVLAIVAWNMAEKEEFAKSTARVVGRCDRAYGDILAHYFRGFNNGDRDRRNIRGLPALHRMAEAVEVEGGGRMVSEDEADKTGVERTVYDPLCLRCRCYGLPDQRGFLFRSHRSCQRRAQSYWSAAQDFRT